MNGIEEFAKLYEDGFFDEVPMSIRELEEMYEVFGGKPYKMKYYLIHHNIMPTWGVSGEALTDEEAVYQKCLDDNITWEEYTGYKPPDKDELW